MGVGFWCANGDCAEQSCLKSGALNQSKEIEPFSVPDVGYADFVAFR